MSKMYLRYYIGWVSVCVCMCAPNVFAEDPEGSGVEQQPRDEEQQVEVGVHLLHALFPAGHVVFAL